MLLWSVVMSETINFDEMGEAWQYEEPYFVLERDAVQNTGLSTKYTPDQEVRRGVTVSVMDATQLERPFWQKTVWERPLPFYDRRLKMARTAARQIIKGRSLIELSRIP